MLLNSGCKIGLYSVVEVLLLLCCCTTAVVLVLLCCCTAVVLLCILLLSYYCCTLLYNICNVRYILAALPYLGCECISLSVGRFVCVSGCGAVCVDVVVMYLVRVSCFVSPVCFCVCVGRNMRICSVFTRLPFGGCQSDYEQRRR